MTPFKGGLMKKKRRIWLLILLISALAVPGLAKTSAHGSKSSKRSKTHSSHKKTHHKSLPKVQKVEHPMDDGPPAGWH
jgi:hypothetical protein